MKDRSCKSWSSLIYGLDWPQRLSCHESSPLPILCHRLSSLALWWLLQPKRILGAGLCSSDTNLCGLFICRGKQLQFKTSSLFPCCLPGLLSTVMDVSSLQKISHQCFLFPTFRSYMLQLCGRTVSYHLLKGASPSFCSVLCSCQTMGTFRQTSPCHFPYGYQFTAFSLDLLATGCDEDSGVQRVPQNVSFQVSKLHLIQSLELF